MFSAMPAIRTPSMHCTLKTSLGSFLGFASSCDERRRFINLFPSYSDEYFSNPAEMQGSLSQWIGSSPMLSELSEVYEPVSQCPPPVLPRQPTYGDHYLSGDEPLDPNAFNWSYTDTASASPSGSPYPGFLAESGFAISPSISITDSSPRSENGVLTPPSREYNPGVYDYDYPTSSGSYPTDHAHAGSSSAPWSTHHSPKSLSLSPSPSPSHGDGHDGHSSTSRDPSPVGEHSGGEKSDRRKLPCLILGCDRRFTSQYTLKVHMEAHKPKPKVTFPCTEGCSERFSRQHDRLRHEVAKHGKVCEFLCDDCGRFFGSKKTLGNHKCPVAQGGTRWVTG